MERRGYLGAIGKSVGMRIQRRREAEFLLFSLAGKRQVAICDCLRWAGCLDTPRSPVHNQGKGCWGAVGIPSYRGLSTPHFPASLTQTCPTLDQQQQRHQQQRPSLLEPHGWVAVPPSRSACSMAPAALSGLGCSGLEVPPPPVQLVGPAQGLSL